MGLQQVYSQYVNEQRLYGRNGYAALDFRCQQLFRHVDTLVGKRLLEVGGGEGLFSMWALVKGFGRTIVLEPEGDGSSSGVGGRFTQHRMALGFSSDQLVFVPTTLQEYKAEDAPFDVILSYSSINHIDEDACMMLGSSAHARSAYVHVFERLFSWLRPGGSFVISDAGRVNYWNRLGMRCPVAPTIEWQKHQEPEFWMDLLAHAGFEFVAQHWHQFYPLRSLGSLSSNRTVARLTSSQFVLTVRRPQ